MITHDGFDRQLTAWLDDSARAAPPDYLDETLSAIGSLHQRPSWTFPGRWLPATIHIRRVAPAGPVPIVAVLTLLLAAGLVALAVVGGWLRVPPKLPPPYGVADAGLMAFDSNGQIVLAEPDGSGIRPLHPSEARQFGATFSRDGTRVAFWQEDGWKVVGGGSTERAADLWVVDVDGSHAVNLTPDLPVAPGQFAPAGTWSPDGTSIAFTADKDAPMYVVATDGSTPPRAIGDGMLLPMFPTWSPDGSRIAFAGPERLADGTLGVSRVYVIRPDGTGQEQVSRDSTGGGSTGLLSQWSPDGRMLLYAVDVSAPTDPAIDSPPTELEVVLAERGSAGWTERVVVERSATVIATFSNDGTRIAFLRSRPDMFEGDLFIVGVDGSGERMVSDRLIDMSTPCWSPDDRTITMVTGPAPPDFFALFGRPNRVYVQFPVDGATLVEIPAGTVAGVLACSWQRLAP